MQLSVTCAIRYGVNDRDREDIGVAVDPSLGVGIRRIGLARAAASSGRACRRRVRRIAINL